MQTFFYTFKSKNHTDTSAEYFAALGMSDDQIDSVLNQMQFEHTKTEKKERAWRNKELARADIELNKAQDGGGGVVSDWRDYRNALRNMPEHSDFPSNIARPIAPDFNQ